MISAGFYHVFANSPPALGLYALCSAILALHLIALAMGTGIMRSIRKVWVNPEDARFGNAAKAEAEHPDVDRVRRAHQNAIENAIPFFVMGLLYVLAGASTAGAKGYFFTFTAARLLHTVFFVWGVQPYRTICWGVGVLAIVGMGWKVIAAVT